MKRLLGPVIACCLGALLVACGGGGDDKDNLGVTISAVPTRSLEALGDFATLTPVPTLAVPTAVPTTAPPAPTNTPAPPAPATTSQAQAPAATPTPQPPPPASAATPVPIVNGTPGPNNTFTYGAGPVSGAGGCGPVGSTQVGPPGSQGQILQGAPPPAGPPAGQVFTTGVGGGEPMAGLAGFLGMSTAQLQSEMSQKGATQASVAARHGKSRDQLKAFLIEQTRKMTAEAVSKGQMTQAQAAQLVNQFTTEVDKMIDGAGGCGPVTFAPGPGR